MDTQLEGMSSRLKTAEAYRNQISRLTQKVFLLEAKLRRTQALLEKEEKKNAKETDTSSQ